MSDQDYLLPVVINTNTKSLLDDAAKRNKMNPYLYVKKLLSDAAGEEYERQQCEDARTV